VGLGTALANLRLCPLMIREGNFHLRFDGAGLVPGVHWLDRLVAVDDDQVAGVGEVEAVAGDRGRMPVAGRARRACGLDEAIAAGIRRSTLPARNASLCPTPGPRAGGRGWRDMLQAAGSDSVSAASAASRAINHSLAARRVIRTAVQALKNLGPVPASHIS
jgi:hypothetical protein